MFTTAELFGKFHSPLKETAQPLRRQPLHHLESLLADRLDPALLAPNPDKTNSRERLYTPKLSFLAFLDQTLNPDASCREAVRQIRAYYQQQPDPQRLDKDTSAYCQARARWSLPELREVRRHLAEHMPRLPLPLAWPIARPLKLIDGTCLNLPDTPANRQEYPQSKDQKPECAFRYCAWSASFHWRTARCWSTFTAPTPPAKMPSTNSCGPPLNRVTSWAAIATSAPGAP